MSDLSERVQRLVDNGIRPLGFEEIPRTALEMRPSKGIGRRSLVAGLAAALLIAAVVVSGLVISANDAPQGPGDRPAVLPRSNAAAIAVLDEAASNARTFNSDVLGSGQQLHLTESFLVHGFVRGSSGQSFSYDVPGSGTWELNPNGSGTEQIVLGDPSFPTPTDQSVWISLGSVALVPVHQINEELPLTPADSQSLAGQNGLGAPPQTPTIIPYSEVAALPTDSATLLQTLVDRYENGHLDVGQTFDLVANLLEEGAGSAQRSALYKVIATLPGVTLDGPTVTDVTHQQGMGVSIDGSDVRQELIFDPATSSVLEERNVVGPAWPTTLPTPENGTPTATVGTQILAYTVFQG